MGDLSPHFGSHEFVDRRTGHRYDPHPHLVQVLEKIRAKRGLPVRIVSGHRCCSSNDAVDGADQSRHIAGEAADLLPGVVTTAEAAAAGAVGIGSKGPWAVHVDVRPGPAARWTY